MAPAFHRYLLAGLVLGVGAAGALAAGGDGSTAGGHSGLNADQVFTQTYAGSFRGSAVAAGCGFRATGPPLSDGTITIAGIPAGAVVTKAILNWTILGDVPPSPDAVFHPIGDPSSVVTGQLLGTDQGPCWAPALVFGYSADVSCLVTPEGNGTYRVEVPDSGNTAVGPSAEGAALIVVYCDAGTSGRDIVVYEGLQTQATGSSVQTVTGFDAGSFGGAGTDLALATFVVSDGQAPLGFGFEGTGSIDGVEVIPAWDGDEGASCSSPEGMYFDVDTVAVESLVPIGTTSIDAEVTSIGDCLTWSAFLFEVSSVTFGACPGPPSCVPCVEPTAALAPVDPICPGEIATLDALASVPDPACPALEYQFEEGVSVLQPFGPVPTFDVSPLAATTYQVRVRCADNPACAGVDTVLVDILPDPIPGDQGNVVRAVRLADAVEFSYVGAPATAWRLTRDPDKFRLGMTPMVPDAFATNYLDGGALLRLPDDYYRLRGLSPCTLTAGP